MLETLFRPNLAGVAQQPATLGRTFFVNGITGNNGNSGQDPSLPVLTIAYALSLCTADQNDYIIVLDCWQEAMPIAVNITQVHIIGYSHSPIVPYPILNAAADTAIMQLTAATANLCEIAGISFGGGNAHGAIEFTNTPMGVNIHNCVFGHFFSGQTPLHGIFLDANNTTAISIQNCFFYGSGNTVGGTITADGINWDGTGVSRGGIIYNNWFLGCPGIAIDIVDNLIGGIIQNNSIALDADTAGAGITMGATATGNLIAGNLAVFGEAAAQNPYLDNAGANANHWAANMGPGASLAATPFLLTA